MAHTKIALIVGSLLGMAMPAWAEKDHDHAHGHESEQKTDAKAEAGHTQLGAHAHGEGKLNIAIAGKTVAIELEIPAADIIGFEHAARTDQQKARLNEGTAKLAKPLALFVPNADANCTLNQADVDTVGAIADAHGEHGEHDKHSDHDKHAEHDEHDKHGEDDKHDEHAHAESESSDESHSEFRATYAISCANPDQLTQIALAFFKAFANAKELNVALVGDKGTRTFTGSREDATLKLDDAR